MLKSSDIPNIPMMDINAKYGDKIMVTEESATQGLPDDQDLVEENLRVGEVYTVDYIYQRGFDSKVFIIEKPHIPFNTVSFEDAS